MENVQKWNPKKDAVFLSEKHWNYMNLMMISRRKTSPFLLRLHFNTNKNLVL